MANCEVKGEIFVCNSYYFNELFNICQYVLEICCTYVVHSVLHMVSLVRVLPTTLALFKSYFSTVV